MNTAAEPSRTYVSYGQQVNVERAGGIVVIEQRVRETVQAHALTQKETDHLRAIYVPTRAGASAVEVLRTSSAVALVGPPGCGRRITGVAAITDLRATPHPVYLDPDDVRRELPADPGCGYLVDIDDQAVRDIPALRDLIVGYGERLAAASAYLVVTATPEAWNMLEVQTGMSAVTVRPPDSVDIFRSHLEYIRPGEAGRWGADPEIMTILDGASPADAARLAELADASLSSATGDDAIHQTIAAHKNWTTELAKWFRSNQEGYPRALLIAAAALSGADAATVLDAADQLIETVKLPHPPGGGLVGDDVTTLLGQIGAILTQDGRVLLPRPAYAASVLDHVWHDRPHLRADLRRWLVGLPGSSRTPEAIYAGYSLVDLAVRQGNASLITHAIGAWAEQRECRALAATALTEAAVSDSIGRTVRRTMYVWASRAGTTQSLQLTVADVCGGPFGRSFPRNALTRLRHLAVNGGAEVHARVAASLQALSVEPAVRDFTLREIVRWTADASQARIPGISAFIALGADNYADLIPRTLEDSARTELLADGLRAALRDPDRVLQAWEVCRAWLEAAAQGELAVDVVTEVIAGTCQDSYDIGLLTPVIWRWAQASDVPATFPREEIATQLLRKTADRDPLAPSVPATTVYRQRSEEPR